MSAWHHGEQLFPGANSLWEEHGQLVSLLTQEESGSGDPCDFNIRGTK